MNASQFKEIYNYYQNDDKLMKFVIISLYLKIGVIYEWILPGYMTRRLLWQAQEDCQRVRQAAVLARHCSQNQVMYILVFVLMPLVQLVFALTMPPQQQ